ncbi:MAG: hypothetical protein HRT35_08125 [Algicola sp.]|nr:hypothetical protein [Algicola sp.]
MRQPNESNFSNKSPILRFMIALLVFVVIAVTGGGYFSNVFDIVKTTEAETAVQSYAASVINLHKNWIMQGKPDIVTIRGVNKEGKAGNQWVFLMNKAGWPINVIDGTEKPDCTALWHALQKATRLQFASVVRKMRRADNGELSPPKFSADRAARDKSLIWVCQNIVAQQLHFRYRLDTGKVEIEQ